MSSALENVELNAGAGGELIAVDTISDGQETPANVQAQAVKILLGASGVNDGLVNAANPMPVEAVGDVNVTGSVGVTGVVSVAGTVIVSEVETTVTVSGAVSVSNDVVVVGTDAEDATAVGAPVRIAGVDATGNIKSIDVREDPTDGVRRLQVEGRVAITAPVPPPTTTPVSITYSGALSITTNRTDNYVITDSKRFVVQSIVAGSEGDTSERGSVVEVYYFDGTTQHIIERVYLNGFTTAVYPDTQQARDGTICLGDGATKTIRVVRRRLSGSAQEVDFVVRGYEYTP
jgi:hypothetical protein